MWILTNDASHFYLCHVQRGRGYRSSNSNSCPFLKLIKGAPLYKFSTVSDQSHLLVQCQRPLSKKLSPCPRDTLCWSLLNTVHQHIWFGFAFLFLDLCKILWCLLHCHLQQQQIFISTLLTDIILCFFYVLQLLLVQILLAYFKRTFTHLPWLSS